MPFHLTLSAPLIGTEDAAEHLQETETLLSTLTSAVCGAESDCTSEQLAELVVCKQRFYELI